MRVTYVGSLNLIERKCSKLVFRKKNKLPTSSIFMSNGLHAQIVQLNTTDTTWMGFKQDLLICLALMTPQE